MNNRILSNICNRWKIVGRPGLEPSAFRWPCKYSTTELPIHRSSHQQLFTLNLPWLHTSPGTLNLSMTFLWGNPWIPNIVPGRTYKLNHLFTVGYLCWKPNVTGEKLWLKHSAFLSPCKHSTTELPIHPVISPKLFTLNLPQLHILQFQTILRCFFNLN